MEDTRSQSTGFLQDGCVSAYYGLMRIFYSQCPALGDTPIIDPLGYSQKRGTSHTSFLQIPVDDAPWGLFHQLDLNMFRVYMIVDNFITISILFSLLPSLLDDSSDFWSGV